MNGEGYSDIQLDNSLKTSLGFTITPDGGTAIRVYDDIIRVNGVWQNTFIVFLGVRKKAGYIGGEFTHKKNLDIQENHNAFGFSATGGVNLSESFDLFARYDYSTSATIPGTNNPWNYLRDGKFFIAGIQKTFSGNVKLALDYQGYYPYRYESENSNLIYINALFSF